MATGRPTKLTDARREKIVDAISLGATFDVVAMHAGVTRGTLNDWRTEGEKALDLAYTVLATLDKRAWKWPTGLTPAILEKEPWRALELVPIRKAKWTKAGTTTEIAKRQEHWPALARFSYEVEEALNVWELRALARITKHSEKRWEAAAWLLERRKPDVYARRKEISGPGGSPIALESRVIVRLPHNGR